MSPADQRTVGRRAGRQLRRSTGRGQLELEPRSRCPAGRDQVARRPQGRRRTRCRPGPGSTATSSSGACSRVGRDVRRFDGSGRRDQRVRAGAAGLDGRASDEGARARRQLDAGFVGTVTWIARLARTGRVPAPGRRTGRGHQVHRGAPGCPDRSARPAVARRADRSARCRDPTSPGGTASARSPATSGCGTWAARLCRAAISEIALPVGGAGANPVPVSTVYVVENEVTYLAFPAVRGRRRPARRGVCRLQTPAVALAGRADCRLLG